MSIIYLCLMNKKRIYLQEYFRIDYKSQDHYLVIIEIEGDLPITSFIVKLPKIYPQFSITPYLAN